MRLGEYPSTPLPVQECACHVAEIAESSGVEQAAVSREHSELAALGFSKPLLSQAAETARLNGTRIQSELLHSGQVNEPALYGAMARFLRLPFIPAIDPALVSDIPLLDTQLKRPLQIRISHRHRAPQVAIVPEAGRLADLAATLSTMPELGRGLAITTPSAVRGAVWQAGAARRVRDTASSLFERSPHMSARIVLAGHQGFHAGLAVAALLSALILSPFETLFFLHVLLSVIYLGSLALRLIAFTRQQFSGGSHHASSRISEGSLLPCYTVMVALYREAAVAEQLVTSLKRLDWPPSLLDVKLICEADDAETIDALSRLHLPPHFEIVEVPPSHPRTKPKALTYALAGARGEFLAIYDAEDRPHPQQLREACSRFRAAPRSSPACRRR